MQQINFKYWCKLDTVAVAKRAVQQITFLPYSFEVFSNQYFCFLGSGFLPALSTVSFLASFICVDVHPKFGGINDISTPDVFVACTLKIQAFVILARTGGVLVIR